MFIGLPLGLIFLLIWLVLRIVAIDYIGYKEWKVNTITIILVIVTITIGGAVGIQIEKVHYNKKIANWSNTKMIIEKSMANESISDLEKIELVNTIVQYNMQLTELKEDVKQWWYFYLDDNKVNELEIIKID